VPLFADLRKVLFSEAASYKPLAILRIGTAFILLAQGAYLWEYRELLLYDNGYIPWSLSDQMMEPLLPRISILAAALAPLGVTSQQATMLVVGAQLVAALCLMLGLGTRASAFVAWLTHLAIMGSGVAYTYGLGKVLLIALFYCLVMPVGREWSLDRRLGRSRSGAVAGEDASLSVLVLRLHVCIIYAAAGLSKAVGEQWWTGDALWRALSLPQFQQFDPAPLLAYPFVLQAAALGSVAIQLLFPVLVWTRLRVATVIAAELLHLGIAIFLGLWLFSGIMIVLNAAAFGESIWRSVTAWLAPRAARGRLGTITVVYDGGCPFCSDYVRYQQLRAAAETVELVDARSDAAALARYGIDPADLEDGMVVIVDGVPHRGDAAVHQLSLLSPTPRHWWIAAVAVVSRSALASRFLYPILKLGRRMALAVLRIPRFSQRERRS
jgi:predicted DCC family thiol-disulfide oxidoreductase YuxK/uncharacterized membrane protein YphA (DoxX/SURF4 family)